jgi:putative ABC transport system permease protein
MLRNYLKVILRNFAADRMYTFINVFGLGVGIAASLMIAQYAQFELSFDKLIPDRDRIFYLYIRAEWQQAIWEGDCHPGVGPLLERTVPEVEAFARMAPVGMDWGSEFVLRREEQNRIQYHSRESDLYFADQAILDIFSIPLLQGKRDKALTEPNTVIITEMLADKFFPQESPLNKTLKIQTTYGISEYEVTGITPNPALNSSLQYAALFSMENTNAIYLKNSKRKTEEVWDHFIYRTFVKLPEAVDPALVEKKFEAALAIPFSDLEKKRNFNFKQSIRLLPITDLHFFRPEVGANTFKFTGDKRVISFFIILACLILIISWVNYINLATARALKRAKEVGLRKVNGARRMDLVVQFLMEFFILNTISLLLAFTLAQGLFPLFADAIGTNAAWILWRQNFFWFSILIFLIVSTLASGAYPAFIVSGYSPSRVLKGNFLTSSMGSVLRKTLVLTQFGFSILLMVSIFVVYRQLDYMQNKDLGMIADQVLVLRASNLDTAIDRRMAFRQWKVKAGNIKNTSHVSAAWLYPGESKTRGQFIYRSLDLNQEGRILGPNMVSSGFFNTMGMTIIEGRDFLENQVSENNKVIINETGILDLGFKDAASAVGQWVTFRKFQDKEYQIIGVVKDFNTSMKVAISGEIFYHDPWHAVTDFDHFLVKLASQDIPGTLNQIEKAWTELFPNSPVEYMFLDTYFDTFYREEQQFGGVFSFFSIIGVILSCMGLFGLSLYNTTSRTKEIGIRKSLGGTAGNIIWIFSKDYMKLVLIAGLFGIPVSYWLLGKWLQNYPNRITLQADVIMIPMLLMIVIAMLTVGYQTFKAAHVNPVQSLKSE